MSNTINCQSCQAANPYTAKFCVSCGNSLAAMSHSPYDSPQQQDAPIMAADYIYAGFWKRVVAYFIDYIIIYILISIISVAVLGVSVAPTNLNFAVAQAVMLVGIWLAICLLYFALLESSSGQATLGKRMLGIKVTDMQGQQLSFAHAAGRQLSGVISNFTFSIGYLMAAFTSRKQALHDIIASAVVVNRHFGPQQIQQVNQNPPKGMSALAIAGVVGLVLIIPITGIIAAIALPAYQDYSIRAGISQGIEHAKSATPAIENYAEESGYWPVNFEQANLNSNEFNTQRYYIQVTNNGSLAITFKKPEKISGRSVYLQPELNNSGRYDWLCYAQKINEAYLPKQCTNKNL
ncbi:RDD family protein [Aliikangiella sp. IMCC44653]